MGSTNGFVSKVYVYLHAVIYLLWGVLAVCFLIYTEWFDLTTVLFILATWLFFFFIDYQRAPLAYKRFSIDSKGITIGRNFLPFSNVKSVEVHRGAVSEWFGLPVIEELTGFQQHLDISLEYVVSFNGDYRGYKNGTDNNPIYIPLNRKTHLLLLRYCEVYKSFTKNRDYRELYSFNDYDRIGMARILFFILLILFSTLALVLNISYMGRIDFLAIAIYFLWLIVLVLCVFKERVAQYLGIITAG